MRAMRGSPLVVSVAAQRLPRTRGSTHTSEAVVTLRPVPGLAATLRTKSRSASNQSTTEIAQSGPPVTQDTPAKPARKPAHRTTAERARHIVDRVNHSLVSPVDWFVPAHANDWIARGVPWLLAMLLYGFGLGYLSRFARGRA